MSTRSTTHFSDHCGTDAIVYKHSDGYPDGEHGMQAVLGRFFDWVEAHWPNDTRYGDASYLAARYVRFLSEIYDNHETLDGTVRPWDGLGIGIVAQDPGDIEYQYTLRCTTGNKRPDISVAEC